MSAASARARRPRATAPEAAPPGPARARRPAHPHRRLGRHGRRRRRSSTTWRAAATSTSSRSPTTSASTPPSPAGRSPPTAACRSRSSSARRSRRAAATCSRCSSRRRDPALPLAARHDRGRPRRGRPGHPGPPAGAVPAVRPGLGPAPPPRRRRRRASARTRIETFNPTALGRPWHARRRPVRRSSTASPHVGNSDAHALAAIGTGWTRFPGRDRRGPARGDRGRHDRAPRHVPRDGRPARHVRAAASQARPRRPRRAASAGCAATAPGRDHGYPGGRQRPPRFDPPDPGRVLGRDEGARVDEDRPRLSVHLPGGRRRRPARPVPLREPAPARARRPDHHRQPRPAALVARATSSGSASGSRCRPTARSAR